LGNLAVFGFARFPKFVDFSGETALFSPISCRSFIWGLGFTSTNPRFPVVFALLFSFSNNTHVESRGFPRVRVFAIPPTPAFLEENEVFFADFFPTVFR
jgi:hypothetical protein